MIWKLLRKNISAAQIAGYALANFIGLVIVVSALRFYGDVRAAVDPDDDAESLIADDYLVISKHVSALGVLGASAEFSPSEIDALRQQPWVADVGPFESADFNVAAAVQLGGNGMQTYMFLESIPDSFIDIQPDDWAFDPSYGTANEIPIILSKDYLSLYNFGFAPSRGLPQLSESIITKVPITLQMSGNGHLDSYRARIVGFSSRLNTIAVPDDFMQWANERYSTGKAKAVSRLIVKVSKPGDPQVNQYMQQHGYEVAGDKLDTSRASFFLTLLTSIVVAVGVIISLLALFILLLSIYLLIQKSREKISGLMLLGYSPRQVAAGYCRLMACVNALVLVAAIITMFSVSHLWQAQLAQLQLQPSSPLMPILAAIVIITIITGINILVIYRQVRKAW